MRAARQNVRASQVVKVKASDASVETSAEGVSAEYAALEGFSVLSTASGDEVPLTSLWGTFTSTPVLPSRKGNAERCFFKVFSSVTF